MKTQHTIGIELAMNALELSSQLRYKYYLEGGLPQEEQDIYVSQINSHLQLVVQMIPELSTCNPRSNAVGLNRAMSSLCIAGEETSGSIIRLLENIGLFQLECEITTAIANIAVWLYGENTKQAQYYINLAQHILGSYTGFNTTGGFCNQETFEAGWIISQEKSAYDMIVKVLTKHPNNTIAGIIIGADIMRWKAIYRDIHANFEATGFSWDEINWAELAEYWRGN